MRKILVTGGCGFIGSCFVKQQISKGNIVVNLDNLTYCANPENLSEIARNKNYIFVKGDICNHNLVSKIINEYQIDWLVNFAAESHVDNSIAGPEIFIQTNINGTFVLLDQAKKYFDTLADTKKDNFRFLHISTDEVFGSLEKDDSPFNQNSNYKPNSPYSASKAASDHLVRAWNETYKLPTIITNCSNNYGPNQHEEKLIPKIIKCCLQGNDITIYGDGKNIRDWIHVEDHCYGIDLALNKGKIGRQYLFGGQNEISNIEIVKMICKIFDEIKPKKIPYSNQIKFVEDRKGHDYRYAIDNRQSLMDLGFRVQKEFNQEIKKLIQAKLNQ